MYEVCTSIELASIHRANSSVELESILNEEGHVL